MEDTQLYWVVIRIEQEEKKLQTTNPKYYRQML